MPISTRVIGTRLEIFWRSTSVREPVTTQRSSIVRHQSRAAFFESCFCAIAHNHNGGAVIIFQQHTRVFGLKAPFLLPHNNTHVITDSSYSSKNNEFMG